MNESDLAPGLAERIVKVRGRLHPFESIEPAKTALVVIDLQNIFMAEWSNYAVADARTIVPAVNRLAGALRAHGGSVAWVRMTYDPASPWRCFYEEMIRPELAGELKAGFTPGSDGHALWPELAVRDGDMIVDKTRFSAFLPNSSDIAGRLHGAGIDTVLVAGTVTNTCCECTARDAMMMDFKTIMISDGCAAAVPALHEATLGNFIQVSGDVRSTDEAIAMMGETIAMMSETSAAAAE